ncbi:MAG: hypothetical protein HY556_06850 [Euryarchaeota archaeon]|nr:hypothetical protein [Euryarchaeota archaeon]
MKRLVRYQPEFAVRAEAEPLETAEDVLKLDERVESMRRDETALWLRGPKEPVLRVRPRRFQDTFSIATRLRKETHTKGFLFFDVDHQAESRWMHSQGLFSMCRLDPDRLMERGSDARSSSALEHGLGLYDGEDRWTFDYPDPGLKTVRLEVKTVKGGHVHSFEDALESVRFGDEELKCAKPGDEAAERGVLRELNARIRTLDPDVLITRHGDRWDIPYLLRRIRKLDLEREVRLGRDEDPLPDRPDQESKSIHTYGRWLFKTNAYYLRGRWHVDLSKKTLDSEDDRKDLHGIIYLSRVANRRAQDVNRNGAGYALQQMQIDLATDWGVALPWKRNLAEDWKDAATLCAVDRGGQIVNPEPGVYSDVVACDFSGYYPSLVVMNNLSSDTINCDCCRDDPEAFVVPELGMRVCKRHYGHQAEILRRLWGHRRYVKAILKRAEREGVVPSTTADEAHAPPLWPS